MSTFLFYVLLIIQLFIIALGIIFSLNAKMYILKCNNKSKIWAFIPILSDLQLFQCAYSTFTGIYLFLFQYFWLALFYNMFANHDCEFVIALNGVNCFNFLFVFFRNKKLLKKYFNLGGFAAALSAFFPKTIFSFAYILLDTDSNDPNSPNTESSNKTSVKNNNIKTISLLLIISLSLSSIFSVETMAKPINIPQNEQVLVVNNDQIPQEFINCIKTRRSEAQNIGKIVKHSLITECEYTMYFSGSGNIPAIDAPIQNLDKYGYNPNHTNTVDYYSYNSKDGSYSCGTICLDCMEHQGTLYYNEKDLPKNLNGTTNEFKKFYKAIHKKPSKSKQPKKEQTKQEESKKEQHTMENHVNEEALKAEQEAKEKEAMYTQRRMLASPAFALVDALELTVGQISSPIGAIMSAVGKNILAEGILGMAVDATGLDTFIDIVNVVSFTGELLGHFLDCYVGEISYGELSGKVTGTVSTFVMTKVVKKLPVFKVFKNSVNVAVSKISSSITKKIVTDVSEEVFENNMEKFFGILSGAF